MIKKFSGTNFHIAPIKKGKINETKLEIYFEDSFKKVTKDFATEKRQYYTYQLKSSKGLCVVMKVIEPEVDPSETKELTEIGNAVKLVSVKINQNRIPQPKFKLEKTSSPNIQSPLPFAQDNQGRRTT